ncbi:hypothetical protein MON38_10655 [Hymenobacter sp. DH14]|uniref:Uncharacterized protein n=1 Tax=Hymenobacter cyanobacteriorum TaxID=2926463 RepID=A0A9X2AF42_9BACT|nr:hypothetical protein [Hymenobacter cyanobacteriorum]MCI1187881.1 hypothetical protein [Hymenobacter cyanobacteriorum]
MHNAQLTLTLTSGQILAVTLNGAAETRVLIEIAAAIAAAKAAEEVKCRTYHMGDKPTAGRNYDDRLTIRTGVGKTKLRELLEAGPVRGGLRRVRAGDKWLVSELAVREFFGD